MKGKLEKFINQHSEDFDYRTPDPDIWESVEKKIVAAKKSEKKQGLIISYRTLWWSAAACIVLAVSIGIWNLNSREGETIQLVSKETKTRTPTPHLLPTEQELQGRKDVFEEIDKDLAIRRNNLKGNLPAKHEQILMARLSESESPANQLRALSETNRLAAISRDVTDVLVHTMNNAANTNVRLAALEGLAKFHKEPYVKRQLVSSLKIQQDPMVQVTLIGLLTRMKESEALTELERLVADEHTVEAVRETAYMGVFALKKS